MNALKTNLSVGVYDAAELVWGTCRVNPCCPVDSPVCRSMQKEINCCVDAGTTERLFPAMVGAGCTGRGSSSTVPCRNTMTRTLLSFVLSFPNSCLCSVFALYPFTFFCCYLHQSFPKKGHVAHEFTMLESSNLHFWASLIAPSQGCACSMVLLARSYQGKHGFTLGGGIQLQLNTKPGSRIYWMEHWKHLFLASLYI